MSAAASAEPLDYAVALLERLRWLVLVPLALGLIALGISFTLPPVYTAKAVVLPPAQSGASSAALALQTLGSLGGLAGGLLGSKSSSDHYAGLLQSATVENQLIDRFDLLKVYRAEFREDARLALRKRTRVGVGKRDGFITIEVDDREPARAAALANAYAAELERLSARLAVGEAKQRRLFFEANLEQTRDRLAQAQRALQSAGFNEGAIRSEPRAAAEGYSRLRADVTAAEVRLQALRGTLTESAVEVQQAQAQLTALRGQLARAEAVSTQAARGDYVDRFREFKYQEALLELFTRQYEAARLDESREGVGLQVLDTATPPERRSGPRRTLIAVVTTVFSAVVIAAGIAIGCAIRGGGTPRAGGLSELGAAAARGLGLRRAGRNGPGPATSVLESP